MEDITSQTLNKDIVLELWRELSIVEVSYSTIRFLGIQYISGEMTETSIQQSPESVQFARACVLPGDVDSVDSEPVRYEIKCEEDTIECNATDDDDVTTANCHLLTNDAGVIEICPSGLSHTSIDSNRTDICYINSSSSAIPQNDMLPAGDTTYIADPFNCVEHFRHGGEQNIIYTSKDSNLLKEHCRKLYADSNIQNKSTSRTIDELKVCNPEAGCIGSSIDHTANTDGVDKGALEAEMQVTELEYPMDNIIRERILKKKKKPKMKFKLSDLLKCARS